MKKKKGRALTCMPIYAYLAGQHPRDFVNVVQMRRGETIDVSARREESRKKLWLIMYGDKTRRNRFSRTARRLLFGFCLWIFCLRFKKKNYLFTKTQVLLLSRRFFLRRRKDVEEPTSIWSARRILAFRHSFPPFPFYGSSSSFRN